MDTPYITRSSNTCKLTINDRQLEVAIGALRTVSKCFNLNDYELTELVSVLDLLQSKYNFNYDPKSHFDIFPTNAPEKMRQL